MDPDKMALLDGMLALSAPRDNHKVHKFMELCRQNDDRLHAVQWMKKTVAVYELRPETRDLSMQLLNRFLSESFARNSYFILNINLTLFGAAISLITASKILEYRPLGMGCFKQFPRSDLMLFESHFLQVLGFNVSPLTTPTSFAHFFLKLWPEHIHHVYIFPLVERLLGQFWELPESVYFAPSTVALSAVLLGLSQCKLDCADFLRYVPVSCVSSAGTAVSTAVVASSYKSAWPSFESILASAALDVDSCLLVFQQLNTQLTRPALVSPVGIDDKKLHAFQKSVGIQVVYFDASILIEEALCKDTDTSADNKRRRLA